MNDATQYFSPQTIKELKNYIKENNGNEITFLGIVEQDGTIHKIEPLTRGNIDSAPALTNLEGPGIVLIHNHPSGDLTPSDADINVASTLGNNLVGFYIINNNVEKVNIVVRPIIEKVEKVTPDELITYLTPDHKKSLGKNIENRNAQKEMLSEVASAFNLNTISIIEAGTGTGKTWAYLIPAMEWTEKNHEKIIVSTFTINLQEQIISDFNYLNQRIKKGKLRIAILKGRNNYLCKLRLEKILSQPSILLPEGVKPEDLDTLKEWASTTESGTISDLTTSIPNELWEEVSATGDTCLNEKCPYYPDNCFYFKSRKESLKSNIIVVNHHLTFADYFFKKNLRDNSIIPGYKRIIFDEAHHIEEAFRSQLERTFSLIGFKRIINKLYRPGKKQPSGLLIASLNFIDPEKISETILNLSTTIEKVESYFQKVFDILPSDENSDTISAEDFLRLKKSNTINDLAESLIQHLAHLSDNIGKISELIKAGDQLLAKEIKAKASKLAEYGEVLEDFYFNRESNLLSVIEINRRLGPRGIKLKIQPIDVSEEMENFYSQMKTVIMTSATLSVNGDFSFFKYWSGLEVMEERVKELSLPSPFNYDSQMKILIPFEIPSPDEAGFSTVASEFLIEALRRSKGRSFVLFTSYRMLENFYKKIFYVLDEENFLLLKQGQFPRNKLLEMFKKGYRAVLFGTDSFWEGVDVAGEKLSMVVITKLPFPVPSDPLYKARAKLIREKGGNEFWDYSLPVASLKLKQGVGRLIRTQKDKGIVIILDKRIITRNYGKVMLASLQSSNIIREKRNKLLLEIESFLEARE